MPRSSGATAAKIVHEPQHFRRVGERPHDGPAEHHGLHLVEPVLEHGGDPEVPSPAAKSPEQVPLRVLVHMDPLAISGHEVNREQVVDGEAELAHQVPETAAERQAADPRVADDPARRGEPGSLRGPVELSPEYAAGGSCEARVRVHADRLHQRKVDHEATVADGVARYRVPSPADRDEQSSIPGEANGFDDVVRTCTARDEGRSPIDRAVPDPSRLLVSLLGRP